MDPEPRYRIEHHTQEDRRVVGYLNEFEPAHHRSLELYAGRLLLDGHTGLVVLIDQTTETLVARRHIRPAPR